MIKSSFAVAIGATLAAGLSAAPPAFGQEETDQRLGTVHFATSCNETAQRRFDRGMRYQHSFWYASSKEIFEDVLKADPECGIAYWGIALSLLFNPHAPPPEPNLPLGLAAIQKAKAVGAKTRHIIREFLSESVVIGLIGGSIGLALGWIITTSINAGTASQNLELFLLTPTLAIGALLFSVVLGGLAGVIPAFSAARLDPVTALRSQ